MARTNFTKAGIEFDIKTIPSPDNKILHVVRILFTNKGNGVIFRPKAKVRIQKFVDGIPELDIVEELTIGDAFGNDRLLSVAYEFSVDVGEMVDFNYHKEFEKRIWAVLYDIEIKSDKSIWNNSIIMANNVQ